MDKKTAVRRRQTDNRPRILARQLCNEELVTVLGGFKSEGSRCLSASDDTPVR